MRLLFVSHSFPPKGRPLANVGGMQRVATELHAALRTTPGVDLDTLALRSSWRWTHLRTPPFLARSWWTLRRKAQRGDLGVVLFSSMVTAALAVPLQRTFRQHGVRTAAIVHGRDVTLPFGPYQRFVPAVFGALDAVLPVSKATGAACQARGLPDRKLHVVPNGVDLGRFNPPRARAEARRLLETALGGGGLPDNALLLCSVGRQVERKGFEWFIERVMPRLPENVHYWLAGDGPESEAIERALCRCGLSERVRVLGRISEADLEALYQGADLFVMPNIPVEGDMEGFGVVMLEAAQCGLPTVAARLEGICDVIEDGQNGHLVESEDAEGFARAIRRYHDDRAALNAASERAYHYVANTFGWPAVARRYAETLRPLQPGAVLPAEAPLAPVAAR